MADKGAGAGLLHGQEMGQVQEGHEWEQKEEVSGKKNRGTGKGLKTQERGRDRG